VARQHGYASIDAYVWEFETDVPLDPECNIDDLLCRTARDAFLERTHIDRLCPDLQTRITQPDGYEDLLGEIEAYQQILSGIDEREIPFDEAVTLWYEIRYLPIIEIIRQRHVLEEFPGRTETDLYLWLCQNQGDLEARYERRVLMEEAADDLSERLGENPLPARQIKGAVGWLAGVVVNWATGLWSALRQALGSEGGR
jgi:hypothetical protein